MYIYRNSQNFRQKYFGKFNFGQFKFQDGCSIQKNFHTGHMIEQWYKVTVRTLLAVAMLFLDNNADNGPVASGSPATGWKYMLQGHR